MSSARINFAQFASFYFPFNVLYPDATFLPLNPRALPSLYLAHTRFLRMFHTSDHAQYGAACKGARTSYVPPISCTTPLKSLGMQSYLVNS